MIRQKKYQLLEQLIIIKIKPSFSLESFTYKKEKKSAFLTKIASKILIKKLFSTNFNNVLKYPSFFSNNLKKREKIVLLKDKNLIVTTFLNINSFFNKALIVYSLKKEYPLNIFNTNLLLIYA